MSICYNTECEHYTDVYTCCCSVISSMYLTLCVDYKTQYDVRAEEGDEMKIKTISREQAGNMWAFMKGDKDTCLRIWADAGYIEKSPLEEARAEYYKFTDKNKTTPENIYVQLLERKVKELQDE